MRALLVVRGNAREHPGGDLVHAEHAAAALRELGIDVELVAHDDPDAAGFDVAHVFGVFDPPIARRQIAAVRARGVPLVLSPIWLDLRAYLTTAPQLERALRARSERGVERRLERLRRDEARLQTRGRAAREAERRLAIQRTLVKAADVLLPASEVEAYLLGERLRIGNIPAIVAPLGIDEAALARPRQPERAGIVCAGRVEAKKNQAALLYALRDLDVDVIIIGRAYDSAYLTLCRRWASPRTRFIEHAPREEVVELMARASVHAHPSWHESPGLSSLEAAAAGAHVVTGDRGCEREYFGADAEYADPADPVSIRDAVVRALTRPPRPNGDVLDARLAARTWRRHAEATREAYERALHGLHAPPARREDSRRR